MRLINYQLIVYQKSIHFGARIERQSHKNYVFKLEKIPYLKDDNLLFFFYSITVLILQFEIIIFYLNYNNDKNFTLDGNDISREIFPIDILT